MTKTAQPSRRRVVNTSEMDDNGKQSFDARLFSDHLFTVMASHGFSSSSESVNDFFSQGTRMVFVKQWVLHQHRPLTHSFQHSGRVFRGVDRKASGKTHLASYLTSCPLVLAYAV